MNLYFINGASTVMATAMLVSCGESHKPLYQNQRFKLYADRVEQDSFAAYASGDSLLVSNYRSAAAYFVKPDVEFKFGINGKDNEMGFNIDHRANILPSGTDTVVLDIVFGKQATLRGYGTQTEGLPPNTAVRFRVDMRHVMKDFEQNGFYEDVHGEKIYRSDFHGLFVAGSTYPLNWDFANLHKNQAAKLLDHDEDGIYETVLSFNVPDGSKKLAAKWHKSKDLSMYPSFSGPLPLLNALYNLSLEEMVLNIESDGTFRTGKEWEGVWTRDISYSIVLSLAMLEPEIAVNSLMRKVKNKRIVQDTGTGGAWPCSSDRVVWVLAAWEIYGYTGDKDWLRLAFEIASKSVDDDEKTVFDKETGLVRGESSFLDWREQTYPKWMEPADIYASLNLGTNAAYYQVLTVLGQMAAELGEPNRWAQKADGIREALNKHLWLAGKGYFGQYLYGRHFKSLSPRAEALGEAFSVLFDVADGGRRRQILANTPVLDFGIPCIYPQIPRTMPYHNNGIWPFVQAFWTMANAKEKHALGVEHGLAALMRQSALFLTNKENFVAQDGDYAGTAINSDRQLWSVAGQLGVVYKVLFGMNFSQHKLQFAPVIPKSFAGTYTLKGVRYRNGIYHITVKGYGDAISSFRIDGKASGAYYIDEQMVGEHTIEIEMNHSFVPMPMALAGNVCSPEQPWPFYRDGKMVWAPIKGAARYGVVRNGEVIEAVIDTTCVVKANKHTDEYQVMAVDESGLESFLGPPVEVAAPYSRKVWEAEGFNLPAERRHGGYSGNGYVAFARNSPSELRFALSVPEAGRYHISFRYANGHGPVNTENKCAVRSLYANGAFVASMVFPQRGTNEWSNWGYSNIQPVDLLKGTNNMVLRFDFFNENMNGNVNDFSLDQICLVRIW